MTATPTAGLTLVGVGPGDPEFLTVAGLRALEAATVLAYPVARPGAEGMAARIAEPWIQPQQRRLPLVFPMVAAAAPRLEAWAAAADLVAQQVAAGERVVFLCEGDVSLFASASYLLLALRRRHPACAVRLIPGITAVAAAAAAGAWPLALQQEQLLISPTPNTPGELAQLLAAAAATGQQLALLKLGQRWRWVRPLLADRGLLASSFVAERVGWPEQRLLPAAELAASELPYFSLLLVRLGWPAVLP